VHRNTVVLMLYETFRTTLPSAARPPAMRHYLINEISGAALSPCCHWLSNFSPAIAAHCVIGPTCDLSDSAIP